MMTFRGPKIVLLSTVLIFCIGNIYLLCETLFWKQRYNPSNISAPVTPFSILQWWESKGVNQTLDLPKRLSSFQTTITLQDQRKLRQLFFKVTDVLKQNNISYQLIYGTLIGAYRHYGMIPWDDDLDLLVDVKDKATIRKLFSNRKYSMMNEFELYWLHQVFSFSKIAIKYVWINDTYRTRHTYWPFVDVYYYVTTGSIIHIYLTNTNLTKDKVFPLKMWPFEGTLQPVPHDFQYVIKKGYGEKVLKQCYMSHRHKIDNLRNQTVNCSDLFPYFPFADYSKSRHAIKVGNKSFPLEL